MFKIVNIDYHVHSNPINKSTGQPYPIGGKLPHVITPADATKQLFEVAPFSLDDARRTEFKNQLFALQIPVDPNPPQPNSPPSPDKAVAYQKTQDAFQDVIRDPNVTLVFDAQNYIKLGGGQHVMNMSVKYNNETAFDVKRDYSNTTYDYKAYGFISILLK